MVAPSRRHSTRPERDDSTSAEARWLRDAATQAVTKGRYGDALEYCLRLEELQPGDPAWPRRTAYCCQRLGRRGDERAALLRAAQSYERAGFLRKACAIYRLAIAIEPTDKSLQKRLKDLSAGQTTGLDSIHPPGTVEFFTPSEPPPGVTPVPGTPVAPLPGSPLARPNAIPRAPSVPDLGSHSADDKLEDEFHLVEFTDADVAPK